MDPIISLSHELIEKGSKSFALAAKLLPRDTRYDAMMLYAWCRHCDDVIDDQIFGFAKETAGAETPAERLEQLREKTKAALEGRADEPVFIAVGRVARKHGMPERHPMELLSGFEMDVNGRVYETLEDTLDYCYHVAGVVGVMMAMIMGVRERQTLNRASDLGIAFQLTNISRDVVEDAKGGRCYLPREWLREAGIDGADLCDPQHRKAVSLVTRRLLREADEYYRIRLVRNAAAAARSRCRHRLRPAGLSRHRTDCRQSRRKRLGQPRHRGQNPEGRGRNLRRHRRPARSHDASHRVCPESDWPLDDARPRKSSSRNRPFVFQKMRRA